ncbi:MAG: tyrosine-type recombinase/integrase, partial [Bacteroidota bacterium]
MPIHLGIIRLKHEWAVTIRFDYDFSIIQKVRKIPRAHWHSEKRVWVVPGGYDMLIAIKEILGADYEILVVNPSDLPVTAISNLSEDGKSAVLKFEQWLISKRYSSSTIKTYLNALQVFLSEQGGKSPAEINGEDFIRFNAEYILKKKLSASYQNQVVNAIKLFFQVVENRLIRIEEMHRPRREHRLPNVLSKEEVKQILDAHGNLKHKTMLSLIYSCGLRRSELITLRPQDIDSRRMLVFIHQGKGKKDRMVPLSPRILDLLREYYKSYKPRV